MKKLLASTALVAMTAVPLYAQTAEQPAADTAAPAANATMGTSDFSYMPAEGEQTLSASNLIGKRIYTAEGEIDASAEMTEANTDWDDVGEISDVLMSRDGQLEAILVDVGGFLGIGEKTVAISMDQLNLIPDGDDAGEYFVAFTASKEQLENAPEFTMPGEEDDQAADQASMNTAATGTAATDGAATTGAASTDTMASDSAATGAATGAAAGTAAGTAAGSSEMAADTAATPPAAEGEQTAAMEVDPTTVTAEQLQGAPVYDSNDEKVGDISELVIADDGTITDAVVDLGGFLGIGAKPVAFSFDDLRMTAEGEDASNLSVHVTQTEEQMEQMPEYSANDG
ncbi:PRC-barrel domain-containing protein [Frigidibacter sp. MR17.24]|uniref:PRC-barrel domain-containing protein n=1 Tax=Frigidibacter sp. MR17.24 TaxID=3127345 RepID=UPI003012FF5A